MMIGPVPDGEEPSKSDGDDADDEEEISLRVQSGHNSLHLPSYTQTVNLSSLYAARPVMRVNMAITKGRMSFHKKKTKKRSKTSEYRSKKALISLNLSGKKA